jgi:tRNA threonylcarbamoyl adenosine modification protein YjeE
MAEPQTETWMLELHDERATVRLARDLAHLVQPGDLVTLAGELGTGKTTLARAVIRRLAADETLEVPSPTFTLLQSYPTRRGIVAHADLYRIGGVGELEELGWEEAGEGAIVMVEWPDRTGGLLPADRVDVILEMIPELGPNARRAILVGRGAMAARLGRLRDGRTFLDAAGWGNASRVHVKGDASTRLYERLVKAGATAILMDSPRRADGPAIRDGKPYSAIAKLAEDVGPYIAVAQALRSLSFSAPEVLSADPERGLVLVEDLGSEGVVHENAPIVERYERATDLLARMHSRELPPTLPLSDGEYRLPAYDEGAMLIETELLLDWYLPYATGHPVSDSERASFISGWRGALEPVLAEPATWTLRDYHSANLIWLADREGIGAVGLIDFQDALFGPPAYDLVSLLQDARVDVSEQLEVHLLRRYLDARRRVTPDMDIAAFLRGYAVLGAQRATKILGIFVRLSVRDGKPGYLKHLPRLQRYLSRDLAHPAMASLSEWYDRALRTPARPGAVAV